jgi:hypothetical protein
MCLDCSKITNQGHQGMISGKEEANLTKPSASSAPHPSGRDHICGKCMRQIPPNTVYGIYEGKQFHSECFSCNRYVII